MRISRRPLPWLLLFLLLPALARAQEAQTQPSAPEKFMRFVDDGHGGGSLQTADVAYRNQAGAVVHLVGAVHIGEKNYYATLNQSFANYDAVLYELITSKGKTIPKPGAPASDNVISQFQHFLKDSLDLDFQLDDIDYSRANFRHADMDKEQFEKMQEDRGETFEQIMFKQLMRALSDPDAAGAQNLDMDDVIKALCRPDGERQVKVLLAKQMDTLDEKAMGLDGPNGNVIVTERNKVALKVLAAALKQGKKNIAIFYGAAHMPDMGTRLGEMGFAPVATDWHTAWDLTIRADKPSVVESLLDNWVHAMSDKK